MSNEEVMHRDHPMRRAANGSGRSVRAWLVVSCLLSLIGLLLVLGDRASVPDELPRHKGSHVSVPGDASQPLLDAGDGTGWARPATAPLEADDAPRPEATVAIDSTNLPTTARLLVEVVEADGTIERGRRVVRVDAQYRPGAGAASVQGETVDGRARLDVPALRTLHVSVMGQGTDEFGIGRLDEEFSAEVRPLAQGGSLDLRFSLPRAVPTEVTVHDAETGYGISGARLAFLMPPLDVGGCASPIVMNADGTAVLDRIRYGPDVARTDGSGRVVLEPLRGRRELVVFAAGYSPLRFGLDAGTGRLSIRLARPALLVVRVAEDPDKPIGRKALVLGPHPDFARRLGCRCDPELVEALEVELEGEETTVQLPESGPYMLIPRRGLKVNGAAGTARIEVSEEGIEYVYLESGKRNVVVLEPAQGKE